MVVVMSTVQSSNRMRACRLYQERHKLEPGQITFDGKPLPNIGGL